ncbi:MAG: single-stranded-DNA-specific exonuclease RecJ [Halanaerobium sp.]
MNTKKMNISQIITKYNVEPLVAELLLERGYDTKQKISDFCFPKFGNLNDPVLVPHLSKVINKILTHIKNDNKIYVFGDYDVDGVTSTVIMYEALKEMEANVEGKISSRFKGGYSFSIQEINEMDDADLIISVDCGISSHDEIAYAKDKGIDIIVIDHHEQPDPPDVDYINLKVKSGLYPFEKLSAAGTTWKVCQHLLEKDYMEMLDLVALSTIADMVPLINENRTIVKWGLLDIIKTNKIGLKKLIELNDLVDISAGDVSYKLAPCINAQGRLGENQISLKLLTTKNENEACALAKKLTIVNEKRKQIENHALEQAKKQIGEDDNFIIIKSDIPKGIVGNVASDIKDEYKKPVIVFGGTDDLYKGSGRGVSPVHLYELISRCDDLLETYGGHEKAIGCSIKEKNIPKLRKELNELTEGIEYKKYWYDKRILTSEINKSLIQDLEIFEPCGVGNPKPRFKISGTPYQIRTSKNGKHLMFKIDEIKCIAFNKGNMKDDLGQDFVSCLEINKYRGRERIQFNVKNILN